MLRGLLQNVNRHLPENMKLRLARLYSGMPFAPPRIAFSPLLDCNYSCSYCFNRNHILPGFARPEHRSASDWIDLFSKFPMSLITVGGGEPLLYAGFVDLVRGLANRHIISQVITNLSVNIDRLIDARDVGFRVMASYHPSMTTLDEFLDNLLRVKSAGLKNVVVNYVATPGNLQDAEYLKEYFESRTGFYFRLDAYESPDRGDQDIDRHPVYGLNLGADREQFNNTSPKDCNGGFRYFVVMPDASVYRCGISLLYSYSDRYRHLASSADLARFRIGNLRDESFSVDKRRFACRSPCRWICDIELANVRMRRR